LIAQEQVSSEFEKIVVQRTLIVGEHASVTLDYTSAGAPPIAMVACFRATETLGTINAENLKRAHAILESNKARGKLVREGF
jgi:hypothetical protein